MNLHDWIDELCDVLDIEVEVDEALILDLASDAAHNVERPAAPISTFLLGYAAAASDGDPAEVERLAGLAVGAGAAVGQVARRARARGRRRRGRGRRSRSSLTDPGEAPGRLS